ncbi:hypothetical protein DIE04_16135 [Burkholderia sp. Bp8994]|nr:hypothetical protein DIE20_18895 [Burkholderia sp. Bp9131]RQR73841.1 hypothetical protein DIE12_13275 [Burkholderia sp. Bp9015]RQR95780.1 hypothetical protein DIE04_16135 [Burkholderia sp. Bp8994]RQS41255.1 hypothetical protein DIE01_12695 [Burkholderia sp. Bp8990]RQZ51052.1 hypothetical protein DIE17_04600 [Burkholderia sp. Bp9099]
MLQAMAHAGATGTMRVRRSTKPPCWPAKRATRPFPFRKGWLSIDRFSPDANAVMIAVIDNTIFRRQS